MIRVQFPAGKEILVFNTMSRLAVQPTQPHNQLVPRFIFFGVKQVVLTAG
jgi:hypothetical protein